MSALSEVVARMIETNPDTDALWAAGLIDLWSGSESPKAIDRAIDRLNAVAAREANSSLAAHHLSIAHLARAAVRDDPGSLYVALEWSERALVADSTDRAVLLTRAIILSHLGAAVFARDEIRIVRERYAERGWAEEIQGRLDDVLMRTERAGWSFAKGERLHDGNLQRARELVFDSMLPAWLEAEVVNRTRLAGEVSSLGAAILSARGDSSVWQMANELRALDHPAGVTALRALLQGVSSYKENLLSQASSELASGVSLMESVNGTSLAAWGRVLLGATQLAVPDFAYAARELRRAIDVADATGSLALRGRSLWALGLVQARRNALPDARRSFEASRDIFLQIREYANAGDVSASLSQVYGVNGAQVAAVRAGFDALTLCAMSGDVPRPAQHIAVAEQLRRNGLLHAAHSLNNASMKRAEQLGRPFDVAEALSWLAKTQAQLGRVDEGLLSIARARELLLAVEDGPANRRITADLDRAEVNVEAARNPKRAVIALDRASSYFGAIPLERAPILLQRGELLFALGDSSGGMAAIEQALATVDSLVAAADARSRRSLLATQRQVRRKLAAVALARADTSRALQQAIAAVGGRYVERSVGDAPPTLHLIALDDQLLSWLAIGDDSRVLVSTVRRDSLGALADRFAALVRTGVDPVAERAVGASLYRLLFNGHASQLHGLTRLDVVVDELLGELPVAALPIDDSTLVVDRLATRMRVYAIQAPLTAPVGKIVRRGPLVVQNPEWSIERFPELEHLRFADGEGESVRSQYPDASLLAGAAATRESVQRELAMHDAIHFAGHARVNTDLPEASHLVLSSNGDKDDGLLFASDIARMDLRHVRLAVLASCGRPPLSSRPVGAANGLTLALLDAGARSVVSGFWEVDDEVASQLMVRFHEALRAGAVPHEALRESQRALLRKPGVRRGAVFAFTTYERASW